VVSKTEGLLTGRYRKGQLTDSRRVSVAPKHLTDQRKLGVVEQLIPLAQKAGRSLTPGVTSPGSTGRCPLPASPPPFCP
jgi:aryl-alcohol dehydrogenase-like predicted oxidoreductase